MKNILLLTMICFVQSQLTTDCQLGITEYMPCIDNSFCSEGFICDHQEKDALLILTGYPQDSSLVGVCRPFVAFGVEPEEVKIKPSHIKYYYNQLLVAL